MLEALLCWLTACAVSGEPYTVRTERTPTGGYSTTVGPTLGPWNYPGPKVIAVPPGYIPAPTVAAQAEWDARCRPRLYTDGYGVNRYVYAAKGCEYGPAR